MQQSVPHRGTVTAGRAVVDLVAVEEVTSKLHSVVVVNVAMRAGDQVVPVVGVLGPPIRDRCRVSLVEATIDPAGNFIGIYDLVNVVAVTVTVVRNRGRDRHVAGAVEAGAAGHAAREGDGAGGLELRGSGGVASAYS